MSDEEKQSIEEQGSTEMPITRPDFAEEEYVSEVEEQEAVHHEESDDSVLSDVEKQAMEQGWKPPDKFDESDKEFVSAAEYLRRGELFEKIKELKSASRSETRRLEKQIEELTNLMHDSKRQGYEQALRDIEARRREAVEIGDIEGFNAADNQYAELKEKLNSIKQSKVSAEPEISDAALQFKERNHDWFNNNTPENSSMVNQAINIDQYLTSNKPYLTEDQRLALVEKELKTLYPHRFSNMHKKRPAKVESAQKASVSRAGDPMKVKFEDLDDNTKAAAKSFLESDPSLTIEDFLRAAELNTK